MSQPNSNPHVAFDPFSASEFLAMREEKLKRVLSMIPGDIVCQYKKKTHQGWELKKYGTVKEIHSDNSGNVWVECIDAEDGSKFHFERYSYDLKETVKMRGYEIEELYNQIGMDKSQLAKRNNIMDESGHRFGDSVRNEEKLPVTKKNIRNQENIPTEYKNLFK